MTRPATLAALLLLPTFALAQSHQSQSQQPYAGPEVIALEAELDRQFVSRSISAPGLQSATTAIGETQGVLRAAHLKYHLLTLDILTPHQVRQYAELRGYAGGQHRPQHHRMH